MAAFGGSTIGPMWRDPAPGDSRPDKSDDWEIATCGGLAGVATLGGGIFVYAFRSKKLAAFEIAFLCAGGIGAGGNQSGIDPQNIQNKDLNFSKPKILEPFSISDIHKTGGFYTCAAVDAGMIPGIGPEVRKGLGKIPISYGISRTVAWRDASHSYFSLRGVGVGAGSSGGAMFVTGQWYSYSLNHNSINPLYDVKTAIDEWSGELDREIRKLYGVPY